VSDRERISVTLESENVAYLDREVNNRSAFINDLIEAHRKGKSEIDEAVARHRKQQLESELRRIESEKSSVQSELEHLEEKLSREEARKQEKLQEARDTLEPGQFVPENPAVENWADKLDMTPEELIEELEGGSDE